MNSFPDRRSLEALCGGWDSNSLFDVCEVTFDHCQGVDLAALHECYPNRDFEIAL